MANIVIFGEAGQGKSSIVNMLLDQYAPGSRVPKVQYAVTGDGAAGVTMEYERYPKIGGAGDGGQLFVVDNMDVILWDTVGLSEAHNPFAGGGTGAQMAFQNLRKLITDLSNQGGVSLLIMVIQKGRLSHAALNNYKLFVEGICNAQVPLLLLITRCEGEDVLNSWLSAVSENRSRTNGQIIVDKGIKAARMECVAAVAGNRRNPFAFVEEYDESREKVKAAIQQIMLRTPWQYRGGIAELIAKAGIVFGKVLSMMWPVSREKILQMVVNFCHSVIPNATMAFIANLVADITGEDPCALRERAEGSEGFLKSIIRAVFY